AARQSRPLTAERCQPVIEHKALPLVRNKLVGSSESRSQIAYCFVSARRYVNPRPLTVAAGQELAGSRQDRSSRPERHHRQAQLSPPERHEAEPPAAHACPAASHRSTPTTGAAVPRGHPDETSRHRLHRNPIDIHATK